MMAIFREKNLPKELESIESRLLDVVEQLRCDALSTTCEELEQIARRLGQWSLILTLHEGRDDTR